MGPGRVGRGGGPVQNEFSKNPARASFMSTLVLPRDALRPVGRDVSLDGVGPLRP